MWPFLLLPSLAVQDPFSPESRSANAPRDAGPACRVVHEVECPFELAWLASLTAVPDLDRDGMPDLILEGGLEPESKSDVPGLVAAYSPTRDVWLWQIRGARSGAPRVLPLEDLDGDGVLDLARSEPDSEHCGRVLLFAGRTAQTIVTLSCSAAPVPIVDFGGRLLRTGDLDGDGSREILLGSADGSLCLAYSVQRRSFVDFWRTRGLESLGSMDPRSVQGMLIETLFPLASVSSWPEGWDTEVVRERALAPSMLMRSRDRDAVFPLGDRDGDGLPEFVLVGAATFEKLPARGVQSVVLISSRSRAAGLRLDADLGWGAGEILQVHDIGDVDCDGHADLGVSIRHTDMRWGVEQWIDLRSGLDGHLLSRWWDDSSPASGFHRLSFCALGDTDGNGRAEIAVCSLDGSPTASVHPGTSRSDKRVGRTWIERIEPVRTK